MGIIRLSFEYLRAKYLSIFPNQTVDEGDSNFQNLNFIAGVADEAQQNTLLIESLNNPYAQTGDLLVKTLGKFGYTPLGGYSAKVRVSIEKQDGNFVGESFNINYLETNDYRAVCIAQEEQGNILLLDIQTDAPAEISFLQDVIVTYTGSLTVGEVSNISLIFSGRVAEGDIDFRTRALTEAITPNRFRLATSYSNAFLEPFPALLINTDNSYSLIFSRSSVITSEKLIFLYLNLNNQVPVRSNLTDEFRQFELDFKNNVTVTFGINIYGTVNLQILVYLKTGTSEADKNKVIALLKSYSYTPTDDTPIYSSDVISSLENVGISVVSGISFVYNGLTNISLTSQGYNDFILDSEDPIIVQEGN